MRKANKLLLNFGYLASGKTIGNLITFVLFVFLSQSFGREGIGQYSFAMAFTGFFGMFAEFGLRGLSIRHLSRINHGVGAEFGPFLVLRLFFSAMALSILLLVLPFLPFAYEEKLLIVLIGGYQLLYRLADGFAAMFIAREENLFFSLQEVSVRVATAVAAVMVIMAGGGLAAAVAVFPLVAALQLAVDIFLVVKRYGPPRFAGSMKDLFSLIREAMPFAESLILVQLYSRIDVVLLGTLMGAAAAGVYNVAYRVVFMLIFVPHMASVTIFPLASRLYVEAKGELPGLYRKMLNHCILAGLPASAGLWLIAPQLIALLFGKDFAESVYVLRYLAWLLFITFLSRMMVTLLSSCDRMAEVTRCQRKTAVLNIAGNLLLIPKLGVVGAAIATLISESLLVILLLKRMKDDFGVPRVASRLVIGTLGSMSFCILFILFPSHSLVVVVPVAVMLYVAVLMLFKDIRRNEARILWQKLKRN